MVEVIRNWLIQHGTEAQLALYGGYLVVAVTIVILAWLVNFIARRFILSAITYLVKRTSTRWDDALLNRKVFLRLSHLAPALVFYLSAPLFEPVQGVIERLAIVYMILVGLAVIFSFLDALVDIYGTFQVSRQRPVKGYAQIAKIIFAVFLTIYAVGTLMNRSPWLLLSGLGAMTAVLLLVFKDSILGLVASVQLSSNDMVRIGDWIEMPKYGADGDVIDVTLHTVKVRNWDKTITTIPSYALISDSFKNWRGMTESGGRRIKRAVNIDMTTIKFVDSVLLERLTKIQLLTPYLESRSKEIDEYNRTHDIDRSVLVNGRNMTNVGTFRAYIAAYLRHHPKISQDLTFLIRQLPPNEYGLPMEVYVFSADQVWANYESIQADIFDHILAVLPYFDLRAFQSPSGYDMRSLRGDSSAS